MHHATPDELDFPSYTSAETAADCVVHLLGVPGSVLCVWWLLASLPPSAGRKLTVTLLIYGIGLIGMLTASAAYNLTRPGRAKELLRRADHAMIFVMIAGTYTPFALDVLPSPDGEIFFAAVWLVAACGVCLKLFFPRRLDRYSLLLYFGIGWMILGMIRSFVALLPLLVFLLLLLGGFAYTFGAILHERARMPFHNAVWHALVLVGAGLHLTAIRIQILPGH